MALLCPGQRFADQFVRKYELRICNERDWKAEVLHALRAGIGLQPHFTIFEALKLSLEPLATLDRLPEVDPALMPRPVLEVGRSDKRPVDPRRRNLEPIGARDLGA